MSQKTMSSISRKKGLLDSSIFGFVGIAWTGKHLKMHKSWEYFFRNLLLTLKLIHCACVRGEDFVFKALDYWCRETCMFFQKNVVQNVSVSFHSHQFQCLFKIVTTELVFLGWKLFEISSKKWKLIDLLSSGFDMSACGQPIRLIYEKQILAEVKENVQLKRETSSCVFKL